MHAELPRIVPGTPFCSARTARADWTATFPLFLGQGLIVLRQLTAWTTALCSVTPMAFHSFRAIFFSLPKLVQKDLTIESLSFSSLLVQERIFEVASTALLTGNLLLWHRRSV
jgi:hypothetical protein